VNKDTVRANLAEAELQNARLKIKSLEHDIAHLAQSAHRHKVARRAATFSGVGGKTDKVEKLRVIFGDTHGSMIDRKSANSFLADVKILNPDEIIMLGDHVDCGGFLAQHHVMGYVAQTDYSYEEDIKCANEFLDALQKVAPNASIDYIEGNHERRVETWCVTQTLRHAKDAEHLRRAFAPEYMLKLKERGINYYRQSEFYDDCRVPGMIKRGKCFFWHGVSTAKHAGSANLTQISGNVVFGHVHRIQAEVSRPVATGEIAAWCPGCLCNMQPLWQHTNPTSWTQGFAIQTVAKDGTFLHQNVQIIDHKSLLGSLMEKISQ